MLWAFRIYLYVGRLTSVSTPRHWYLRDEWIRRLP